MPLELRPTARLDGTAVRQAPTGTAPPCSTTSSVVNGRRLLLYSQHTTDRCPQESNEDLWVVDLDTGERKLVANGIGGWEFGTSRLHLGANGLIVGQRN